MIRKIYDNEATVVERGDVVFAVFKSTTATFERLRYQHAALYISEQPTHLNQQTQAIQVAEVIDYPNTGDWPNIKKDYYPNLIGKVDREDFGQRERNIICSTASSIVECTPYILKMYGEEKCDWNMQKYKFVKKSDNHEDVIEELHFTCSGFVEYCYETAGLDIIHDNPQCFVDHLDLSVTSCPNSPLPLTKFQKKLVHRLYPGYLIHAFRKDKYSLDLSTYSDHSQLRYYEHGVVSTNHPKVE